MQFCLYPCPCGWYGDPVKECTCFHAMVSRYQADPRAVRRISGPLLDRIETGRRTSRSPASRPARKPGEKLSDERLGEPSADVRGRVKAARERQRGRFEGTALMSNAIALAYARVGPGEVRDYCQVDDARG